ncbi:hypothetical protein L484_024906 [Morus notabilis]|uniref:Uncharacterized protein n=1 Tax=Morus notabilis TaxID=981085 RepID=W9RDW8_9ROSA|nr:hypothetical protein L484_024906 [Morus notabilis]
MTENIHVVLPLFVFLSSWVCNHDKESPARQRIFTIVGLSPEMNYAGLPTTARRAGQSVIDSDQSLAFSFLRQDSSIISFSILLSQSVSHINLPLTGRSNNKLPQ